MTPAPWKPVLAVSITLVFWASAFVAIRHLADDFGPGAMALGRLVVGAVCLTVIVVWSRLRSRVRLVAPTPNQWWRIIAIGLLWYAVYMVALNTGEHHVDAGTASLVLQLSPVVIAVLAAIFLDERFTRWIAIGLALAFLGVAIIALSSGGGADADGPVLGVLLCLVSVAAYSISLVLQKPLAGRIPALQLIWMACGIGAIATLPWAGQLVHDLSEAPAASILWLVYLGVCPTAVAFTTYGYALQHLSASQLGISTYVVPVISIALAAVLLGEAPAPLAYVGGVVALAGVWVARRRPRAIA
ncbi:DMT family transporter [Nocardioides sp. Kera G14]|uniref:DMT family transporter n=1 Tax=Nocardioides sp. Kera G14 TaxID=2884264 RepID=UPI001D118CE8|nr:DMT family transporter [Nocardioides sp. Kera G14]UDY24179.1 DMT family transporter [Nocardioides sp. Kera G14]